MPFFTENQILNVSQPGLSPETPAKEQPPLSSSSSSFLDTAKAYYKLDDIAFNIFKAIKDEKEQFTYNPDFPAIDTLQARNPELVKYVKRFVGVGSEEEYNHIVNKIGYEQQQREIIANANTLTRLAAAFTAGVADPINLIFGVGTVIKASRLGVLVVGALQGALAGTAAQATQEAILQPLQETRTLTESGANVAAGALFGSILGGGVALLADPVRRAGQNIFAKALTGEDGYSIHVDPLTDSFQVVSAKGSTQWNRSAGAAEVNELDKLALARVNENVAKVISGFEFMRAPDLRAALSKSSTVRKLGESFYNSTYIRKKNLEGEASASVRAQNEISRWDVETRDISKETARLYLEYTEKGLLGSTLLRSKDKISAKDFYTRIWRVMTDENVVDEISQVNKAASIMRHEMDKVVKELQDIKLLKEDIDPKFMRNYMTRIYDRDKLSIPEVRGKFISKVSDWIRLHDKEGKPRVVPLDEDVAETTAENILERIRGESDQQIALSSMAENIISNGSFTKKRELLIPDKEIEEFLITDSYQLFQNYMRKASRLLEVQKTLDRLGFKSINDVVKSIQSEASKATAGLKGKQAIEISKYYKDQEDLAKLMYRSMLGQLYKPGKGDQFVSTLLNYQFVRLLGGVTISSLPEIMSIPWRRGFLTTFEHGILPLIKDLKAAKLAKDQLNDLSAANAFESSGTLRALDGTDDINNLGRNRNAWDRFNEVMSTGLVKLSGIGYWTAGVRRLATYVTASDFARQITKGPKGEQIVRLAAAGIGKQDYAKIAKQIKKHATEYNGSFMVNPDLWDDLEALQIYKNAVQNEVESTILKPGVESQPFLVQQYAMGKILFQFKTFMNAATGKITISNLQRRDALVLAGMINLIAAGTATSALKHLLAGRDVPEDPITLLSDGISQSGLMGLVLTTGLDLGRMMANSNSRFFGSKFASGSLLGPSVGLIDDIVQAGQELTDGSISNKDFKVVQRLIPYGNLFYIQGLTNRVFGDPPKHR